MDNQRNPSNVSFLLGERWLHVCHTDALVNLSHLGIGNVLIHQKKLREGWGEKFGGESLRKKNASALGNQPIQCQN